ncbi:OLC1v1038144C1 [Oldenlandia corymbosa var. corymbosa]|uniref:OLC1v1038144C1 n=1 Tax=Oldenlandia corymbosa var. corymbosa TaxID=529605 RepID=A0AAV1D042_OLDCO|nr:OLC1v1038144C1 [Oldenlandia corymbosa var. corymbosa]
MAFDQNSIPKDLRPLNIVRGVPEDPRIATVASSGRPIEAFYGNPHRDGSPSSVVYYPPAPAASEPGFVNLGFAGNGAIPVPAPGTIPLTGVASWVPRVAPPQPTGIVGVPGVNVGSGTFSNQNIQNIGVRSVGSASEASDDGGDDSVSGKKVKFMCSFGGNILPRPSDGALRYVGGQTRIISVRRDISFGELVQKMMDIYGQSVVIKYQLPDEDLDALVSVSCPDDLENMMDEYEKLLERSSDGSAKLRIFLFSATEADSAVMVHIGDWQDNGQKYVEAVNGFMDGSGKSVISRKESNASAASTQSSDVNGTEVVDSRGLCEITSPTSVGVASPRENIVASQEAVARVAGDPSVLAESSSAPPGIPLSTSAAVPSGYPLSSSGHPQLSVHLENELERSVPGSGQHEKGIELQHPGVSYPAASPYFYAYGDAQQEAFSRSDFVQAPAQMGFPAQLLAPVSPMIAPQQMNATGTTHQQFVPAVHMTMVPSSHVSMNPNMIQPQQIVLERYPGDSPMGPRIVHVPTDQGYHAYHHTQVPHAMIGGAYGWPQVSQTEHVVLPDGYVPHQQVVAPEKLSQFEDCHMCQKALPHAHSDTLAQDQRESPLSTIADPKSFYHSLRLDDRGRPVNTPLTAAALAEAAGEQQGSGSQLKVVGNDAGNPHSDGSRLPQSVEVFYVNDRIIHQRAENSEHPRVPVPPGVIGFNGGIPPTPYGVVVGTTPQTSPESGVLPVPIPTQYLLRQDPVMSKPISTETPATGGIPVLTSDYLPHESPKGYSGNFPVSVPVEENVKPAYDHLKQIDGRMENLRVSPTGVSAKIEQSTSASDNVKREGTLEGRSQQVGGREAYLEALNVPRAVPVVNHVNLNDISPPSNEVLSNPNLHQAEYHDVAQLAQPPLLVDPGMYTQTKLGVNLVPDDISGQNSSSAVDNSHSSERIPPVIDWKDTVPWHQPNVVSAGMEAVLPDGNTPSSVSPSYIGDVQDSSNSLFSNQDPWNLQHENHFPPPRPSKLQLKKDSFGTRDASGENRFDNVELVTGNNNGLITDDRISHPSANSNIDVTSEHSRRSKGSSEDLIKQELQAVAEGVAASVLQTSANSNTDLSGHGRSNSTSRSFQNIEVHNIDKGGMNTDKFEDVKARVPEKTNIGFPVSDGRLQVEIWFAMFLSLSWRYNLSFVNFFNLRLLCGCLQIIKNSDLEEIRELGSGTFGTVYYGKWRGTDVAIKRINDRCFAGKPSEELRMKDDFWNEANILADLHHPNVVAFYGVVLDGPDGSFATVTEYMVNGSLRTALQKSERNLDKRKRILIAMDVAFGMEYLHGKKIVHFDLKSDNLLVNLRDPHRPICKVGDLGLSKVKCQTLISGGVRGTLPWMAPELLNGSSNLVSDKVDVYSFGIVMWELLTGEEPYADLHYGAIIGGIVSNTLRPPVPETCDPDWKSLMERCWAAEPSERPSFSEIANELRAMATKIPPKGQNQQQVPSKQAQVKS